MFNLNFYIFNFIFLIPQSRHPPRWLGIKKANPLTLIKSTCQTQTPQILGSEETWHWCVAPSLQSGAPFRGWWLWEWPPSSPLRPVSSEEVRLGVQLWLWKRWQEDRPPSGSHRPGAKLLRTSCLASGKLRYLCISLCPSRNKEHPLLLGLPWR